jgi:hypothetical protein
MDEEVRDVKHQRLVQHLQPERAPQVAHNRAVKRCYRRMETDTFRRSQQLQT